MTHTPEPIGLAADRRREARGGHMLGVGAMLFFAAGFPASELLLETWDPLALVAARLLMAVSVLLVLWVIAEGPRRVLSARWGRGTLVGGLAFGLGTSLLLIGQWMTDPVTVAIVVTAMPLAGTLVEIVMDRRGVGRAFATGLAVSVFGGIVAVGGADGASVDRGALAALLAVLLFAWGSRATVHDFPELTPLGRTTVTLGGALLFGGTVFFIAHAFGLSAGPSAPVDAAQFGLLAIYALGAMALSQLMWIASVGRLGVALASFHLNAVPFYVMLFMFVLGAGWSWPQVVGAVIVAAGVAMAQRSRG